MNYKKLKEEWKKEEQYTFRGWDFSYIDDRCDSEELPWDYKEIILNNIKPSDRLLDMGTGGGEFLLALSHPYKLTSVTESYQPNVELCKKKLSTLGIEVKQIIEDSNIPYSNDKFDIVINKHEAFDINEVKRILKKDGFQILYTNEYFPQNKFYDIGALVYFAKIIEWEFPGFSVDTCFDNLYKLQKELEEKCFVMGTEHRFIIVARNK